MRPSKQQIAIGTFLRVGGQWHKRCTGPAHSEPTYLPANEKYFYIRKKTRPGEFVSLCRLCTNWTKLKSPGSEHGWVPIRVAHPFYVEAVNRVGLNELSQRTGLSCNGLASVLAMDRKNVQKAKLRLVVLELISMRRKGEHLENGQARWRTEARNNAYHETCSGCGTPASNYTDGCETCTNRRNKRGQRDVKPKRTRRRAKPAALGARSS